MAAGQLDDTNGLSKKVYARVKGKIQSLHPDVAVYQKILGDYDPDADKVGESYNVPVVLQRPNSVTFVGSSPTASTNYLAGQPMVIKQASITPTVIHLPETQELTALGRAAASGVGSFAKFAVPLYAAMMDTMRTRLELGYVRGQKGLGTVDSINDLGGSPKKMEIVITAATWSAGIWYALGPGATLDSFTSTTKNNASGALKITAVDDDNRKITVEYTGTAVDEVDPGDVLYQEGAYTGSAFKEMAGAIAFASNTGSLAGIDAATYMNWKGNTMDIDGPISTDVIQEIAGKMRNRGANGELLFMLSQKRYGIVANEYIARGVIDQRYNPSNQKQGQKEISFEAYGFGKIMIVPHPFIHDGELLCSKPSSCTKVGGSAPRFGIPGFDTEDFPRWERSLTATEATCFMYGDEGYLNKTPNHSLYGTGITD